MEVFLRVVVVVEVPLVAVVVEVFLGVVVVC